MECCLLHYGSGLWTARGKVLQSRRLASPQRSPALAQQLTGVIRSPRAKVDCVDSVELHMAIPSQEARKTNSFCFPKIFKKGTCFMPCLLYICPKMIPECEDQAHMPAALEHSSVVSQTPTQTKEADKSSKCTVLLFSLFLSFF